MGNTVYDAVCFLASVCDGAGARDGSGFNKYDTVYKGLADVPESSWSERDLYKAWKAIGKYRGQLAEAGIIYSEIPAPNNGLPPADKMIGALSSGEFCVIFPYNPGLVAEVKALPKRRFDGDSKPKRWIVAPVIENVTALWDFAQRHPDFDITPGALDLMAAIDAAQDSTPAQPQPAQPQPAQPAQPQATIWQPAPETPAPAPETPAQPVYDGALEVNAKKVVVTFSAIPSGEDREWMKKLEGWDYKNRQWTFPAKHALALAQKFPNHEGADILLADVRMQEEKANKNLIETRAKLHAAINLDAPLPSGRVPFKHQREGINFMLDNHKVILADDMGLGKTFQSLIVAKAWRAAFGYPAFVICPASVKDSWLREAAQVETPIEIYSWAKMPEIPDRPFVLIADEAHAAQAGTKSTRGKAFLELAASENCQAVIAATGTPMKNGRPSNLWPLLRAVDADFAIDKKAFERRYCAAGPTRFSKWDTSGAAHLDELHERCKPYMLRRLKKDCTDLPGKTRTMRVVDLSGKARAEYDKRFNALREDYFNRLKVADENKKVITDRYMAGEIEQEEYEDLLSAELSHEGEQLVLLTHLRLSMSLAKVETGIELAEDVLGEGRSVVIFTDFAESAKQIADALRDHGVELLTGEVTGNDKDAGTSKRQAMIDRFQSGKSKVFVSTIRAGGVGITLTAASDVIMVDRPWVPGDAEQAEDRCNRIGQTVMVSCQWVQAGEIDVKIDEILVQKQSRIDQVLEGKRSTMRATGGSITGKAMQMLFDMFDNKR